MTKHYLLLLPLFAVFACKSPSKAFNQGNYTDAIELAVRKLQKNPTDADARQIVQSAYSYAVHQHEDKIRNLSTLNSDTRWEQLYYQYSQLQYLHDKIYESPAAAQAVNPTNYASYLTTYGDKSAETHVQKAVLLLNDQTGNKAAYRDAYYELRTALKFRPNDAAILEQLQNAKEAATVHVLLVPMDVNGRYRNNTFYAFRNFEADLVRRIRSGVTNEFLEIMTGPESRSGDIEPDEIVEMRLGTFNVGRPYDENNMRTVTKDVVVKETVYSKDSVIKEYAKVKAKIVITKRVVVSTADLYLDVRDGQRRTLWNDQARADHRWATEFATFTGDERALSDNDKELLKKQPQTPPREEEVVDQLLHELADNAVQRLRSYYCRN